MTPRDDDQRVADLEAEIASHLLHAEADLRARGRDAREAAHEARRTFGNVRIVTDATHRQWAAEPLAAVKRGWRLAWRSVREAPAAAAGAVLALSAALTAVGTLGVVFDRLWWRPVPGVLAPERVVRVYGAGFWTAPTRAFVEYLDLREGASTLAGVAAYRVQPQSVDVRGSVARLRVAEVTSDYFEVLGVPVVGAPPDAHGCVVSTAVARQAGRTPGDLLGSALQVGARRTQVRGVAAAAFEGVDLGTVDLWCALPDLPRDRGAYDGVHVIGRLRAGVTRDDADRDVNRVSRAGWQRDGQPLDANVMQLGPLAMTRGVTRPVDVDVVRWLLVLAVSLLLAAVGTVSTVLLTRTLAAGPTRAVRVALGASRWRLAREPLMAGVVLGGLSAPIALVATSLLVSRFVPHLLAYERTWHLALDGALALVALALCSGLLAGSLAAARSYPTRLSTYLADMRTQRLTSPRLLRAVLVAQTTVAMVLLVAALHVVGGFTRIAGQPLGLQLDGLHVVTVESLTAGQPAREAQWLEALLDDAQALGELEGAALTHTVPFQSSWRTRAHIEGRDPEVWHAQGGGRVNRLSRFVSTTYFDVVGTRLLRGRGFTDADTAQSPRVVVVDEVLARVLWPSGEALGQCLRLHTPQQPCATVVGVVEAARHEAYFEPWPGQYYVPLAQAIRDEVPTAMLVRLRRESDAATVRTRLQERLASQAVVHVRPATAGVDPVLRPWRSAAATMSVVAVIAWLVLAAGAFAVTSESERRRMRDLTIRRALGSSRWRTAITLVRPTALTTVSGIALGLGASWLGLRTLAGVLPHLPPLGGSMVTVAVLTVLASSLVASTPVLYRVLNRNISRVLQEP